jgi:FkbM family methyltransferase
MLAYDVGMNNGDDSRYYLGKGYDVVAIEANPALCAEVGAALHEYVEHGRLRILNLAVAEADGTMEFHVDVDNDARSSLLPQEGQQTRPVTVEARKLSHVIREHGVPDFIKIDVEHVDQVVLHDLIDAGMRPASISAEAHKFEILLLLWQMGYREFRLLNGRTVHLEYRNVPITRVDGSTYTYSFPRHSAGPFGDDLPTPWRGIQHVAAEWLHRHALFGSGWFDVHAR